MPEIRHEKFHSHEPAIQRSVSCFLLVVFNFCKLATNAIRETELQTSHAEVWNFSRQTTVVTHTHICSDGKPLLIILSKKFLY